MFIMFVSELFSMCKRSSRRHWRLVSNCQAFFVLLIYDFSICFLNIFYATWIECGEFSYSFMVFLFSIVYVSFESCNYHLLLSHIVSPLGAIFLQFAASFHASNMYGKIIIWIYKIISHSREHSTQATMRNKKGQIINKSNVQWPNPNKIRNSIPFYNATVEMTFTEEKINK